MSSALIRHAFDAFARRQQRSSSWSRVLGEAPERRIDALELFSGLALTCRATLKDKLSILFYLFDSGETGVLTEDDLGTMISSCASVLRHLKLSLPISTDEAAFAAGAAFGHQDDGSCSNRELAHDVDEIDLSSFLTWAQRAELPTCALEMLELPHRLSRIVDLVSGKAGSILRGHIPETVAKCSSPKANSATGRNESSKGRVPAPRSGRANMLPLLQRGGGYLISRPFALTPSLGRIGPHSANALFEMGTSSHPTAEDSTWHVVVSVEERYGSRFSLVDSQPLNVRVGAPGVLQLSYLRAATDHRLTISWGVATETTKNGGVERKFPGGQHARAECSTLRFTTLPADSLMAGLNPDSETIVTSSSREEASSNKQRQCIALVSAWQQGACPPDEAQRLQPYPTNSSPGNTTRSKGVSVLISRGQRTSLESAESTRGLDPWWVTSTGSTVIDPPSSDQIDARVQLWPLPAPASGHKVSVPPTANNLGEYGAFPSREDVAPFCGEAVVRNEAPAGETAVPWARGGDVESGGIDLMVYLSPDWRAVEAVRRCFQVLRQCRFEIPTVREDGRRMASTEINKAIRSLVSRCFRARRGTLRYGARKSCAHIVLGNLQHPWLGLKEVSTWQCETCSFARELLRGR